MLRELGIGLVAHSPLGRGFSVRRIKKRDDLIPEDRRHAHLASAEGNFERNLLLPAVEHVAKATGLTMAQVALAWLLARGDDIVPIRHQAPDLSGAECAAATEHALDEDWVETP